MYSPEGEVVRPEGSRVPTNSQRPECLVSTPWPSVMTSTKGEFHCSNYNLTRGFCLCYFSTSLFLFTFKSRIDFKEQMTPKIV